MRERRGKKGEAKGGGGDGGGQVGGRSSHGGVGGGGEACPLINLQQVAVSAKWPPSVPTS